MEMGRKVLKVGCTRGQLYMHMMMLGFFPKGEALLSLFVVLYFMSCLVPCSQLGSWPYLWDLGSGLGR